jgi:hypothetical protein
MFTVGLGRRGRRGDEGDEGDKEGRSLLTLDYGLLTMD